MKKKMAKRFGAVTLATVMGVAPVTAMAASDISGHWAEDDINTWLDAGWISGFPDGTMKPNDVVTRAQFVMMLNNILGLTTKGNASFTDVPAGSWFSDAVSIAVAAGYAAGMSDTTFAPDSTVTREQAASFVARAIGATNSGDISQYTDTAAISSWARDAVGSMSTSGYLSGMPDGSFDPQAGLTRAQAVSFLERVRKDHGVSGLPTTDTAALVIDKTATVISNETIEGDVIISSTVREGDVTFDNVHIKGDLLVQGGGANSIYLKDSTVDGKIIMDKANVRLELSGNTIVKTIEVLKVCHIDSKDFTGNVGLINFATSIPNSDGYVVIDVDADEIKLDAVVKVEINTEIGKVTITGNAAGSTVDTGKGAEIGTVVADGKVTITGDGTINKLETNADGVVVGGNVDVENETVADGVTGSGSTSGSSDDTSTSTGSGNNTSDEPWWDNNDSYDDNNNTDPEEVTPTVKNTIAVNSVIAKAAVEKPDPSDYDNGEDDAEYKADYQKYEETKEHNASLQALVDDPNAVALTSTDQFTEATTLRVNDAVALNIDLTEGDIAKLDFDISANEDDDNYVEGEPIEGITATDGYNYYASWSVTDKDGKQLSETEVLAALEKFAYVSEINDASGAPMSMLQGVYTSIDETLVFVAGNFDETVNITAQVIREDRETKDLKLMAYDTIKYTLESTSLNSYEKLKTTIESLNDVNVAAQTPNTPIGDTAAYITELEYDKRNEFGNMVFSLDTYRAFIVPISGDIKTLGADLDDLVINYTGDTPLILVPDNKAENIVDELENSDEMHIEGLYINSTKAPVAIDANIYGLMAENKNSNSYQESVGADYDSLKNEFYVSLSDMKDGSNDTITTSTYDLTIGDMKINVPKSSFATNSTIEDLTVEGAKEIIANAEVTDLRILKGAGTGSGNTGSYGDSNANVGAQNQFTQAASSMQNAVLIRSAYDYVISSTTGGNVAGGTATGSANGADSTSTVYGYGANFYKNVYLEETALTTSNVKRAVIEKEGMVLDIMTVGLAGEATGLPTIVGEKATNLTKVTKIETPYTFATIGSGEVEEIVVTDLNSALPLMIQIETTGNYELQRNNDIHLANVEVGYVAGLDVLPDEMDNYIIAYGGLITNEENDETTSDRLEIVEFLATPVMTINGTPINSTQNVSVDWALDLKDLVYSYSDTNSDDVTIYVEFGGHDLKYTDEAKSTTLETGKTVTDAKFAGIIDALAIRTGYDYLAANTEASAYAKSLYAITTSLDSYDSGKLKNKDSAEVTLKVWAERTQEVVEDGSRSSAKNETTPYIITVTFDAAKTNPTGSENDTTLDAALINANSLLADKYVPNGGLFNGNVTATEFDGDDDFITVPMLFNGTNTSNLFQLDSTGDLPMNAQSIPVKQGSVPKDTDTVYKMSTEDIYVYIANDVFNEYTKAQDEVILDEVTGELKTQDDIAAAATKLHDALTDVEAESMLQVNELYYEYKKYSAIMSGDFSTDLYKTDEYSKYITENLPKIQTQEDVEDAIVVYQKAVDYLISQSVYNNVSDLQKYFAETSNGAQWKTDLIEDDYTEASWTAFNTARETFVAYSLGNVEIFNDAELKKVKEVMLKAVADLEAILQVEAGHMNRYDAMYDAIETVGAFEAKTAAELTGYAAEKINETYIYTTIENDGDAEYELLEGKNTDQEDDSIRFYTQKIYVEGPNNSQDGPDAIYTATDANPTQGLKYFMQSVSPLEYGIADDAEYEGNKFWVNVNLADFKLGQLDGNALAALPTTTGYLASEWASEDEDGLVYDSYANLSGDFVSSTALADAEFNADALDNDNLAIFIPVDRNDLGGNTDTITSGIETLDSNLELLDDENVSAYYYLQIPESKITLNVQLVSGVTTAAAEEVAVPKQVVKFEIAFELANGTEKWSDFAGGNYANLFTPASNNGNGTVAGIGFTTGVIHNGIFAAADIVNGNSVSLSIGDSATKIGQLKIRDFNTSDEQPTTTATPIFSWVLNGGTIAGTSSSSALMLISEEDEYFYTNETSEEKAVGALDADADFVPVETQTDYVGGDLNTEEFLAEGGEIGDSLVELLETSGFEIDTTPAVDTTPTV